MMSYEIELEPLDKSIVVPPSPRGIILLAHAGPADRSPKLVKAHADELSAASFATCMVELASPSTGFQIGNRIDELSQAILWTVNRVRSDRRVRHLPIGGLFSGAASAAAMVAASSDPKAFRAIVSHDGRPDLAEIRLHRVETPSLFLVSRNEREIYEMNRWAQRRVSGLTGMHLLDSSGNNPRELIRRAVVWFDTHLAGTSNQTQRGFFGLRFQRRHQAVSAGTH